MSQRAVRFRRYCESDGDKNGQQQATSKRKFHFRSGDNAGEFHRARNFRAVLSSAAEIRADFLEAFLKFREVRS